MGNNVLGGMSMKLAHRSLSFVLLAVVAAWPATAEDLTIVSSVTTGKGAPVTATQYITADKLRTSDGRLDTIFDIASGRMVHVDHKKKTYWETSLEELRRQFAELEKMLDENPMMASLIGGVAAAVEVEKGSGTREVAGYVCDQYLMSIGQSFQFEIWAARGLQAPAQYYDAQKMAYAAMGPMASRFDKLYDEMKELDGVPLYTKVDTGVMGMKIKTVTEATEVRKGPIPAGTFDPPAGYKKKKSPYGKKK
jgi:hypothetical protein